MRNDNQKKYKFLVFIMLFSLCLFCSCQRQELKEAGLGKQKVVKDKDNNYYQIMPHVGDTFIIEPIDIKEFREF